MNNLPESRLQDGHGNSHLEITTKSDSAQLYFDQGLNMFHSFNYFESYMAFNKAYEFDTNCVMCNLGRFIVVDHQESYDDEAWGNSLDIAINHYYDDTTWREDYEQLILEAYVGPYVIKRKYRKGHAFEMLTTLYESYKDIEQANVLYLMYLDDGLNEFGEPEESTLEAAKVAEDAIKYFPNSSAIQHYYIHLYEDWQPAKVLEIGERIIQSAPNSGHITHMPGHAFYYNGLYHRASEAFMNSYLVDSTYNATYKYAAPLNWNMLHNMHFLCHTLIEEGRNEEALEWHEKIVSLKDKVPYIEEVALGFSNYLETRYQIPWRRGRWKEAIEACGELEEIHDDPVALWFYDGIEIYFTGMEAYRIYNEDSVHVHVKELKKHLKKAKTAAKEAEDLGQDDQGKPKYWGIYRELESLLEILEVLEVNTDGLAENIAEQYQQIVDAIMRVNFGEPPQIMQTAEEVMAIIYTKHQEYDMAIKMLEKSLEKRPNCGINYLDLARLYKRTKEIPKSRDYLDKFYSAWQYADSSLIEFEKARILDLDLKKFPNDPE